MVFDIRQFPDEIQLKILEKLSTTQFHKLRSTSRHIHDFVEEYRYDFSSRRRDKMKICIFIRRERCDVCCLNRQGNALIIPNPYRQLSAFSFGMLMIAIEGNVQPSKFALKDVLLLLHLVKPSTNILMISDNESLDFNFWNAILRRCSFREFSTRGIAGPISNFQQMESIQKSRALKFEISKYENFDKNFIRQLVNVEKIDFIVENIRADRIIHGVFAQMIEDVTKSSKTQLEISFTWNEKIDPISIFPNTYTVYRSSNRHTAYAQTFSNKIFLVFNKEFGPNIRQKWTFYSVEKDKNSLKKALQKDYREKVPDHILDHIFNTVIDKTEAPILAQQSYFSYLKQHIFYDNVIYFIGKFVKFHAFLPESFLLKLYF